MAQSQSMGRIQVMLCCAAVQGKSRMCCAAALLAWSGDRPAAALQCPVTSAAASYRQIVSCWRDVTVDLGDPQRQFCRQAATHRRGERSGNLLL